MPNFPLSDLSGKANLSVHDIWTPFPPMSLNYVKVIIKSAIMFASLTTSILEEVSNIYETL